MPDYTKLVRQNLHRFHHVEAFLPFDNPTFQNPAFDDAPYRVLIVRLSPFQDVDRSTPHLLLFHEVRHALPDAYIDMAFFPSADERDLFEEKGLPYLIGAQSLRSAEAFDLVLISNAYTLELINLPYLLLRSGIPLFASQRGPEWPAIILGGSNAMATQAIIREDGDSLVDGIFFGEGEGWVMRLVSALAQAPSTFTPGGSPDPGRTRMELRETSRIPLSVAEQIEGLWTAGAFYPVTKAVCDAPEVQSLPVAYPLLNSPEAHTANLQITYGCPAFCSFCFEGYDRKPYREIDLPDVLATARELKRAQGVEELNLYSFNFNTHRDILPLLSALHQLFDRVGLKSQRMDILQNTGYLLEAEIAAGKHSYTLGIEGISARQRAWLHKSLRTSDIVSLFERLFSQRIREVKLFYVLTGHETDEDIAEFREFVRELKAIRRAGSRGIRVIFSFGLLIRMPFTPLRYDRLCLDEGAWRPLVGQVKSACETNGFEFRTAFDWSTYCTTQVLALGGYWLVEAIVALARRGYCYDTDLPLGYWHELSAWMGEAGEWNDAFLGEKGPDYPFPLAFVRSRTSPAFLYRQYQRAQAGEDSGYCLGTQDGRGTCLGCGACADEVQRSAIVEHALRIPDAEPYLAGLRETVARKHRLRPAYYLVRLDASLAGVLPEYLNAFVLKGILAQYPELVENLLSVRESLFTVRVNGRAGRARRRFPAMAGETVFALKAWDLEGVRRVLLAAPGQCKEPQGQVTERRAGQVAGFQVLRPAEGFAPGVFTRMRLDLELPASFSPDPRRALDDYLRDAYVPYSLRREDVEGTRYRFDVPEKGTRKKVLYGGSFEIGDDAFRARLDVGPKFDLMALLRAFGGRNLHRRARACVSSLEW